jgi:putative ubiquitin-RnfH superfamily antitoxin RatB of RatAB toxin-antitoxin module
MAIRVEVVYALPGVEDAVSVSLAAGATVGDALDASRVAQRHPGIDLTRLGIHGKAVKAETPVSDGDRVEIYRRLALDPKEARRQRALRKR